jgi:hypothetical protein
LTSVVHYSKPATAMTGIGSDAVSGQIVTQFEIRDGTTIQFDGKLERAANQKAIFLDVHHSFYRRPGLECNWEWGSTQP